MFDTCETGNPARKIDMQKKSTKEKNTVCDCLISRINRLCVCTCFHLCLC